MARRVASIAAGGWSAAAAAAVTIALVALAYQVPLSLDIDLGSGWPGALVARGFHDAEGSYRWSKAASAIVFPDPGANRSVRVELVLSGFRPRGTDPPLLVVESDDEARPALRMTPSRRIETVSFETETRGLWSSTLAVRLRSDTFCPGGLDDRMLGVRLHRARLVLHGPTGPPARQILSALALVVLLFVTLGPGKVRFAGTLGLSLALALGYGFFRLYAASFVPGIALGLWILALAAWLVPSGAHLFRDALQGSARALRQGAAALVTRWAASAAGVALLGAILAYALQPSFSIDLGTGRGDAIQSRFTGYDRAADGTTFRRPLPDATLDLRDFGWGSPWTLSIRAAVETDRETLSPVTAVLVRTNGEDFAADLGREWATYRFDLPDPGPAWRAGRFLTFPGLGNNDLKLDIASIRVDRGVSFPSAHALALLVGSGLVLAAALCAAGLSPPVGASGGAAFALLVAAGMYFEPVLVTPCLGRVLLASGAALGAACCARGWLGALAEREIVPELAPGAIALAMVGLVIWFLATASPLYVGGHFGYHSSIAEEIWRGQFFLYYFPGPDNMLGHQPQWGNLIVPHPSFYHTVAAPFAAFPHETFYLLTKVFLALLLFGLTVSAALMATSAGSRRAGVYAAAVSTGLPTGSQLLGLGHLMTVFGAWAAALGLGFLVVQERRLLRRRETFIGVALVTLCFLSYTGSLLFGSVMLALAVTWLYRSEKDLAMRLAGILLAGWGLALLLYYIHWVAPFVRESLPLFLAGKETEGAGAFDLAARLRLAPEKLSYTFGSWLVPVVGLVGLGLAETRLRRVLLWGWGSVLVSFSALDLFFNFLLKHHYFTLPAIAVGVGLVLERLERKKAWGRLLVAAFLVFLWVMGLAEALRVARGEI